MEVLVTGGKGFIGKHAVKALVDRKHEVAVYDKTEGCDVLDYGQLGDEIAFFNPDVIVHLAGQVHLQSSLDDPQFDAKTNIIGTINVLEVARKYDCKVVFSSSGAVYGSNDRTHIAETHEPEPISPYGVSKRAAEMYVLFYNRYNMNNVVFRFSSVYGSGRKKTSINLIVDKAIKGEEIKITGDGFQTRDFTHVSDVAEALVMAVEGKFPRGIYNIGRGTSTSINGLIGIIEELLGKKLLVEYMPKQEGDPLKNDFNVERAEQYGFKAKVSLKEGIKMLMEEMKNDKT